MMSLRLFRESNALMDFSRIIRYGVNNRGLHRSTVGCIDSQRVFLSSQSGGLSPQSKGLSLKSKYQDNVRSRSYTQGQQSAKFRVNKLTASGSFLCISLNVADIVRNSSIHARDLFSLALTSELEDQEAMRSRPRKLIPRKPPPVILPRGEKVVVCFGHVRAVIGQEEGMLFDAHQPNIQLFAKELSKKFKTKTKEAQEYNIDGTVTQDPDPKAPYVRDPFEVVFLEEILREVCNTWNRRILLYQPIVNSLTTRVSEEVYSEPGIQRLVPLKNSLQSFEIQVAQALDCLTTLLHDDEDMAHLLLTQRAQAREKGREIDIELHESVELLMEEYSRQLHNLSQEISYLLKKVQSKQELIRIALDTYRNRMLRTNVYLSIASICFATSTAVAGFFGMNLVSGWEESPTAFWNVVVATSASGVVLFLGCMYYVSKSRLRKQSMVHFHEIETIGEALSDMNALDYAVKVLMESDSSMTKEEFGTALTAAKSDVTVTDQEIDLLFNILDQSQDGLIHRHEIKEVDTEYQNSRR